MKYSECENMKYTGKYTLKKLEILPRIKESVQHLQSESAVCPVQRETVSK